MTRAPASSSARRSKRTATRSTLPRTDGARSSWLAADPPAAMVLDVMLPGLDGFSVVERMKADLPGGGPPVVMLTIVDEPERAARLGVEAYLRKPFDTDELLRRVRRLTGAAARI